MHNASVPENTGIKPPTYHRQRLLLFMLEQAGGTLGRLDLQKRIALTCFEKEPHCCHRHCVSDFLAEQHGLSVVHL